MLKVLEGLRDLWPWTPARITQGPQASQALPPLGRIPSGSRHTRVFLLLLPAGLPTQETSAPAQGSFCCLLPPHPQPDLTWPLLLRGGPQCISGTRDGAQPFTFTSTCWGGYLHFYKGETRAYRRQIICYKPQSYNWQGRVWTWSDHCNHTTVPLARSALEFLLGSFKSPLQIFLLMFFLKMSPRNIGSEASEETLQEWPFRMSLLQGKNWM